MEMLKCKTTIALVIMILSVAFIGGLENSSLENNTNNPQNNISVNA